MSNNTVLITGGAGYIGSHVVLALRAAGWSPVVIDNLSTGHRELIADDVPFVHGDVADTELVAKVLNEHDCQRIMHFAGSIIVPESVTNPLKYYRNNTSATRNLIEAALAHGVDHFVFSSTAAVYGDPDVVPLVEDAPLEPINPYGRSKLMTEWMLRDVAASSSMRFVALRYFNVAGADPAGRSGQWSENATHLLKIACETALGKRPQISIFGTDYDTADGTCVRDYIHVSDLADAHVKALKYLNDGGESVALNCGYGHGFSVREVLQTVSQASGKPLNVVEAPRRPGDPPELISDSGQIRKKFSWAPRYDDLKVIVETALAWEKNLSQYADR